MKLKRNLSTKANREFWAHADRVAKEVESWPASLKSSVVFATCNRPKKKEFLEWR